MHQQLVFTNITHRRKGRAKWRVHHLLLSQGSEGSIDLQSVGACRGLIVFIRVCVRSEEWISHYMLLCAKQCGLYEPSTADTRKKIYQTDNDRECCYCKNKIYLYLIWEHRSKQTHSKVRLHQFHRVAGFLCHLLLDFTIRRYNSTRVALLSSFFKKTKQKKPHLLVEVSADQVFLASLYASMASSLGHPMSTPVETMHI